MNLKQLGILIAVMLVIGGAVMTMHKHQESSWTGGGAEVGKKLLGDKFPFNDVAHISIKHGTNELNLVKKDDLWRVRERANYPANFSQISEFLVKASELKIVQIEEIGPSQLARMELAPGQGSNSAVVVEMTDLAEKPISTLLLGKKHLKKSPTPSLSEGEEGGFPDGRYVAVGTNTHQVALISDALETVDANPDQWLNKDFIHVEKPKTIEVDFPVATNSWHLARETESGDWKLANTNAGEELDSSKVSGVTSPFSSPTFTSVQPGGKLDESGTNKPTVVKVDTFDDFHYTIHVGAKTNDDYFVTVSVTGIPPTARPTGTTKEEPDDKALLDKRFKDLQQKFTDKLKQEQSCEQWTYLVPSWTVDSLLKERSQLLAEKKTEPETKGATEKTGETTEMPPLTPLPKN